MNGTLLTGGTGNLGRAIIQSGQFENILTPSSTELDICDPKSIDLFLRLNKVNNIIHAAAMARLVGSETSPIEAIRKNIIGTSNLVSAVLHAEVTNSCSIRFLHISTDGIYAGTDGNYSEASPTIPRTKYGWSKLGSECAVRILSNYCIIRSRFFDTERIPFETSASDIFTSKIPIYELVSYINQILHSDYVGVINVGGERISDFDCHRKFKKEIKECSREEIVREVPFEVPKDISMNISKLKDIFGQIL